MRLGKNITIFFLGAIFVAAVKNSAIFSILGGILALGISKLIEIIQKDRTKT